MKNAKDGLRPLITLVFTGPAELQAKAVEVMRSIGFTNTGEGKPWHSAFPEFAGNEQGAILRGARLKEELTQKELAEKTGIPQRHISEMETGKRSIGKKAGRSVGRGAERGGPPDLVVRLNISPA